ncbi:hypothetical protein C1H46_032581 [Malus baccata]|uniref:Protein kinase domain-containing protein n=1 Tax=Malus baccata TaxID=106549 RepID=A0A540L5R9_MALBA|nr:hypothetical protein C1H46_032581 [Malus baccata]
MLGNIRGKIKMEMERMILKLGHHLLRKLFWFSLISLFLLAPLPLSEANSNTSFRTAGVHWPDIINCNTSYRPTNPGPFSRTSNLDGAIPLANPDGICSGDAYYDDLIFQVYLGNFDAVAGDTTIRVNRSKYYDHFSKANQAYSHDHRKTGRRYIKHKKVISVKLTLGLGFFCLFMSFGITGIYSSVKKRKFINLKAKFFQQNGGLLLEQHIASHGSPKVFTAEELETAAAYYNQSHNFCPGESALDCKGLLSDGAIVDMRKTVVHEGQIERFIYEIVTLTKINHKNVVKFLGCCLETEAPMLVYEFPCNGTLFDYIHHANGKSALPWHVLLKIASDSATALASMHSAVDSLKPMIIHGNMKTLVQQTLGYLDPEYLYTGQLTDKSDVYSFGIVLLELLTGEMPLSFHRPENQRIITSHFVSSVGQNDIFQIVVPQLVNEGNREQLRAVAELAKSCLKLSSAERPAMEEVARELRRLCGSTHSS